MSSAARAKRSLWVLAAGIEVSILSIAAGGNGLATIGFRHEARDNQGQSTHGASHLTTPAKGTRSIEPKRLTKPIPLAGTLNKVPNLAYWGLSHRTIS